MCVYKFSYVNIDVPAGVSAYILHYNRNQLETQNIILKGTTLITNFNVISKSTT